MMSDRKAKAIASSSKEIQLSLDLRNSLAYESFEVQNWFSNFHVWDYIFASSTDKKTQWKTNSRYPLSPELLYKHWRSDDKLIGVRFQTAKYGQTNYTMIDIDTHSQYHPAKNEKSFRKILDTLEKIGLCRYLLVQSSKSEGLHIYFPLPKPIECHKLSWLLKETIESSGIIVAPGQLEIFPNARSSSKVNYQAHRLPLQGGSFVLDENYDIVHNSIERFVEAWENTKISQDIEKLEELLEKFKLYQPKDSEDIKEWRERLETTLKTGWQSSGETNRIIKEVCIYGRVFRGFEWDTLEEWVLIRIVKLPGYEKYCAHQKEIKKRVHDWINANRKSNRYYPYSYQVKKQRTKDINQNEIKSKEALARIQEAINNIKIRFGNLPEGVKARQILICKEAKCSASTLQKYKYLWHPEWTKASDGSST